MRTKLRSGRRVSRRLETIGVVGEADDAELDEAFRLRGVDLRLGIGLASSWAVHCGLSCSEVSFDFNARDLLRFNAGDGVCGGMRSTFPADPS